jgi:hypothetical protein
LGSPSDRLLPRNGVDVEPRTTTQAALIARLHELSRIVSSAQREMLSCLAELEHHEAWLDDGAHDMPHWVSMQLGVSRWKAERWVAAGAALESLPGIATSFAVGEIGIDKVVELTWFATPDDEEALLAWAGDVASRAIRRRGEELRRAERTRSSRSRRTAGSHGAGPTKGGACSWRPSCRPRRARS